MSQTGQITALQRYSRMSNNEVVLRGTALVNSLAGNPNYPKPPVNLVALQAAIDLLQAMIVAARDGDKKVIAQRNRQREEVIKQIRLLVRYVEIACNGDMAVFRSSSLEPAYATRRPQEQWSETIRRIQRGDNSGTMLVFINADPKASSYQLGYAALGREETPDSWTTVLVSNVKSAVTISGLTPGTTYAFQVRKLLKTGYTDWTDPITIMCT